MMQRDNKPTENQLVRLYGWFQWRLPIPLARDAIKWAENNMTRAQMSKEISRVYELFHSSKLTERTCFDSDAWAGYKIKERE